MIEIPMWKEIATRVRDMNDILDTRGRHLNPLEKFIYDNEPAGGKDTKEFREGLQEVLEWVMDTYA